MCVCVSEGKEESAKRKARKERKLMDEVKYYMRSRWPLTQTEAKTGVRNE